MGALIAWIYRTGLKRGSKGGHWSWYIVALAALILRRDRERRSSPVVNFPLKPGDKVLVTMRELGTTSDS